MTGDDFLRISKKWLRGFTAGYVIAAVSGLFLLCFLFCGFYIAHKFGADRQTIVREEDMPLGVPDDFLDQYAIAAAEFPEPFRSAAPGIEQQDNRFKNVRLYEACESLNAGPQMTGDCVSWGGATCIKVRASVQAKVNQIRGPPSHVFPPHLYGLTRVQVGGNRPRCGQAGAYPSDFVNAFRRFGWVYYSEAEAAGINYSGRIADQWGCHGPPRNLVELGQTRAGGDAYPIRSVNEWRDAICNLYPVTVAFPWKPGRLYRGEDGRWCMAFDGDNRGGHQVCSLAYDGSSGKPYWLLFNSHGADWPRGATREDNTPPGSIWVDQTWAPWIVRNGELWALNNVPGFSAEEFDLSIFDPLKRQN